MIREVILPQLAMGMSEGTIVDWFVTEGAKIQREQPFVSIETEKVTTEIPAPYSGYVHLIAKAGDVLPVETPMARIAETEVEYRSLVDSEDKTAAAVATPNKTTNDVALPVAGHEDSLPAGRVRASGLAKSAARKNDVDLTTVAGTGPNGRIEERDVMAAVEARKSPAAASPPASSGNGAMREKARIPLTGARGTIADRMIQAKTSAAHVYAFFEVDVTKLSAMRQTMLSREKELGGRISMLSFYVRAVAMACQQVPICNATLSGREITVWDNVNIGIAVALPGKGNYDSNLVVPVVCNADKKGVLEIDREIKTFVVRAKAGELTASDMANGTITVSSTAGFMPGAWSVSTPLLNLPQVVNFQPGSPIEKPVVIDGNIAVRTILPCGLSFDHRALDGEPVGKFGRKMADLLSNPELMVL